MNASYHVTRLHPDVLDEHTKDAFAAFVEPKHQKLLQEKSGVLAVGATCDGVPIGILLAECMPKIQTAQVLTFFVAEPHRQHHVGTELLTKLQEELKKENFQLIIMNYTTGEPWTPILEHITSLLGWPKPRNIEIQCLFDGFTFNPPWMQREYALPTGYHIFPWSQLLPEQRRRLEHQQKGGFFSENLSPFKNEELVEPLNSLGLEFKGEVIGWMVTHRVAPDTIEYKSFFIQRHWQMSGLSVLLLRESIKLQKSSTVKWAKLKVSIEDTEPSWIHFVKRRLVPYAERVTYLRQAWCNLGE